MKKAQLINVVLMCVGASTVSAGTMGTSYIPGSFVASISAGPVWPIDPGRSQNLTLAPEIEKTYTATNADQTLADGELFLGLQTGLPYSLVGQWGLAVATTSQFSFSGEVWDDTFAEFNNYTYSYKLRHTHIAAKGKLLADRGYFVTPWISASIGVAFNQSNSFISTPLIYEAVNMPPFANHTTTDFTYTVGAGIQRNITQNCQVGVGYEFADWGKSNLGVADGQTTTQVLSRPHLYTNGLMFNITYVA